MKRVGDLFDRVVDRTNLGLAAYRAALGKRDRGEVRKFFANFESNIEGIGEDLRGGRTRFGPYRSFSVLDTKKRTIHAPPFRDRVIHHAIIAVVGPVLERGAIEHSYACRSGKGQHFALCQARRWTRRGD